MRFQLANSVAISFISLDYYDSCRDSSESESIILRLSMIIFVISFRSETISNRYIIASQRSFVRPDPPWFAFIVSKVDGNISILSRCDDINNVAVGGFFSTYTTRTPFLLNICFDTLTFVDDIDSAACADYFRGQTKSTLCTLVDLRNNPSHVHKLFVT